MKVAAVILTTDRSPRHNYLSATLESLFASGLPSNSSFSLDIFHSGQASSNLNSALLRDPQINLIQEPTQLHFNAGLRTALEKALQRDCDWVLFMEDDNCVCSEFPEFVISQLELANEKPMVDFITYYDCIKEAYFSGERFLELDAKSFYGTQCFAIRSDAALSFSKYIGDNESSKVGFADTWFDDWLVSTGQPRTIYSSVPSATQHTGRDSNHGHNFITAPAFKDDLDKTIAVPTLKFELISINAFQRALRPHDDGELFELNEAAQIIYMSVDGNRSIGDIVNELAGHIDVDRTILNQQIRACIHTLTQIGALSYQEYGPNKSNALRCD